LKNDNEWWLDCKLEGDSHGLFEGTILMLVLGGSK